MGNYQQKVKSFDFVLKVISETSMYRKSQAPECEASTKHQCPPRATFSELSVIEKGMLRKKAVEYLNEQRSGSLRQALCISTEQSVQKPLHGSVFELIRAIKSKCLEEPGIFRREGDRDAYKRLVAQMAGGETIDFSKYNVLVLGSALKSYIRDHLDGFFDPSHFEVVVKHFKEKGRQKLCSYLLFSLSPERQRCFQGLREVFEKVEAHQELTKMSHESLCNIFCLTMTPGSVFKNVNVVPIVIEIFKVLLRHDCDDISLLVGQE